MRKVFLIILLLIILAAVFTLQNSANVEIFFFFWNLELPLALVIVFSITTGAILGILFSIPKKRKNKIPGKDSPDSNSLKDIHKEN